MAGRAPGPLCQIGRVTTRRLLKTVWPVLRRGPRSVQFGTDAARATVLEGLHPDEVDAVQELDGTRELPAALQTPAGRELLDLLLAHRLVVDVGLPSPLPPHVRSLLAHDTQAWLRATPTSSQGYAGLTGRVAARLLVAGTGDLPAALAAQLRRAGVGSVWQGPQAADDWDHTPSRGAAAGGSAGAREVALVVVVGCGAVDSAAATPWQARGTPVLPVVLHGLEAVIGPVVLPGGPCLRCLDLARADLDPAWPAVLGQLVPVTVGAGPEVSGETTLVAMAASMAAMVALAVLEGHPVPRGRSLEFALPWPVVRQRQWEAHPRCSCTARSDPSWRPGDGGATAQAMMAG
jgi:hypothetical protein